MDFNIIFKGIFKHDVDFDLSDYNQFMVNRILSSIDNCKYLRKINYIQCNYKNLSNREHYLLMISIIPKGYHKYNKKSIYKYINSVYKLKKEANQLNINHKDYILNYDKLDRKTKNRNNKILKEINYFIN